MLTMRIRSTGLLTFILALAPATRLLAQTDAKPNILFILADNLGYGELGCYGGGATRGAPAPRIDKLASEGLRPAPGYAQARELLKV